MTEPNVTRCSPPIMKGIFPSERIADVLTDISARVLETLPKGSSKSPLSKNL